ncbi:MAG: lipoyl(octanoyl) transferase LipB [Anaerolineae bacterium]
MNPTLTSATPYSKISLPRAAQTLTVQDLGRMPYLEAWALQRELAKQRGADQIVDTLLWVEHPHTYTLGTAAKREHLLLSEAELLKRNIAVHEVDRGGDITYHGEGQLVGYPIVKLPAGSDGLHADVIAYVRGLEAWIIALLARYGITGYPIDGLTGVWVNSPSGPEKIAAIGVRVTTKRVTFHGFALNVTTDLRYFEGIIPCGIRDKGVTSLQKVLGRAVSLGEVRSQMEDLLAWISR